MLVELLNLYIFLVLRSSFMAQSIVAVTVEIIMVTALLPVIAVTIAGTQNLSATETTILGLATLFLILGLIFGIVKGSGLMKK